MPKNHKTQFRILPLRILGLTPTLWNFILCISWWLSQNFSWKSHYFSELLTIPLIHLRLWLYFCTVLPKSQKFFHRRVSMSSTCHNVADDWTLCFGFGNSRSRIFPNLGNVGLIDSTVHQLEWDEFSYYRGSSPITQHFYKCIILAKGCSDMFAQHFWPLQQIEDNGNR